MKRVVTRSGVQDNTPRVDTEGQSLSDDTPLPVSLWTQYDWWMVITMLHGASLCKESNTQYRSWCRLHITRAVISYLLVRLADCWLLIGYFPPLLSPIGCYSPVFQKPMTDRYLFNLIKLYLINLINFILQPTRRHHEYQWDPQSLYTNIFMPRLQNNDNK